MDNGGIGRSDVWMLDYYGFGLLIIKDIVVIRLIGAD
jgi:hypothetical protein